MIERQHVSATDSRICRECGVVFEFPLSRGRTRWVCSEQCRSARDAKLRSTRVRTTQCRADGCGKPANRVAAQLCEVHYCRLRRNGHLDLRPKPPRKRVPVTEATCVTCAATWQRVAQYGRMPDMCPRCAGMQLSSKIWVIKCVSCASAFVLPARSGQKPRMCARCVDASVYAAEAATAAAEAVKAARLRPLRAIQCPVCSTVFHTRALDGRMTCSRACRSAYVKRVREANPPPPKQRKQCEWCDKPIAPYHRTTCGSKACVAARAHKAWTRRKIGQQQGNCSECGQLFVYTGVLRLTCGKACAVVRWSRTSGGNGVRRARRRGQQADPVDPIAVLSRDQWICQLCGISTPRRLRGKNVRNAPTVDHIIPIARGGAHTYDNVQCACRACNTTKGAKMRGQLRIPMAGAASDRCGCGD